MELAGANVAVDLSLSVDEDVGFVALRWHDRVSEPFVGTLDVVGREASVEPERFLGATVGLTIRGGSRRVQHLWAEIDRAEHRGSRRGLAEYRFRLRPQLARLAWRRRTRTLRDVAVHDVVEDVLAEHGVAPPLFRTTHSFEPRGLVVQYDETDLDFVARLLAEEPVWWTVTHDTGGHRLVVTDRATDRRRKLRVVRTAADGDGLVEWVVAAERGPSGVHVSASGRATAVGIDVREVVHVVADDARVRDAAHTIVGIDLEVEAHDDEAPTTERAPAVLVTDLVAVPVDVVPPVVVPPRTLTGRPVTATVVGPAGEQLWVDERGRVQIEIEGADDDSAPVWVPVAQPWAGPVHGTTYWPRIGDRVWVEFEEGDLTRPVVTGSLYTEDAPPPAALPAEKQRTMTTSPAGRFELDDRPGDERVAIAATRDLAVTLDGDLLVDGEADATIEVADELVIEAGTQLELRCGSTSIVLSAGGDVLVRGDDVTVEGTSTIDLTSPSVTGT